MLSEQSGIQVDKFYPPTDWQYSFPEGYTRLEYLESTGTQYIDTGVYLTGDSRVKIKAQTSYTGDGQRLFGTQYTNKIFRFGTSGSVAWYPGYYNGAQSVSFSNDKNIFELDFNKNNVYINNELIKEYTYHSFTASNTAYLFTINATSLTGHWRGKVYNCLIWDSGSILIRNLVPVKRNSDNKPGMYDLVNNVFYVNQGTGEFVMGPELYSNNSQIDIRQKNNTNFVEKYKFNENNELVWANPQLNLSGPVGYTKVGNLTITDNVVSGFSANNFLRLNQPFNPSNNIWEVNLKIQTSSDITNDQYIFRSYINNDDISHRYGINFFIKNSKFGLDISSTGYSWTVSQYGNNTIMINTTYWVSFGWDGAKYYLKYSIDGINYITDIEVNNINNVYNSLGITELGIYWYNKYYVQFKGSIDLNNTYITINNELWFFNNLHTFGNIAPVPAGFAYNNTTTPSIGYVNTQTQVFTPAPTDGIKYSQTRDIKVIPPEDNTITLLYGVASDFSKYALFGLLASVSSGTYDVYIDDVLYATTASGTQTDIDFSTLGSEYVSIGTCTTPESLVLHKIVIKPTTSGETITGFKPIRTTGISTAQKQGILWIDFNLDNFININNIFRYDTYIIIAITAKNNTINANVNYGIFQNANTLKFLPNIIGNKSTVSFGYSFRGTALKRLIIKDMTSSDCDSSFRAMSNIEQINTNINTLRTNTLATFENDYKLKTVPYYNKNSYLAGDKFAYVLNQNASLYPTKFDLSDKPNIPRILLSGTSTYPMRGLRGLKVSNEAPFTGGSPQINVSYTGLDRDALVELFNSLPTVTDGQTINITAATGNNLTKVGTPTIDENGVASGFSSADYIQISNFPYTADSFEINIKATTTNTGLQQRCLYRSVNFQLRVSSSSFEWELYVNGINTSLGQTPSSYPYVRIKKGNVISVYLSQDGITYSKVADNIAMGSVTDGTLTFSATGNIWQGSIDLENTYIKVGNNYLMKGYLLDSDKVIATNKGWTITG